MAYAVMLSIKSKGKEKEKKDVQIDGFCLPKFLGVSQGFG